MAFTGVQSIAFKVPVRPRGKSSLVVLRQLSLQKKRTSKYAKKISQVSLFGNFENKSTFTVSPGGTAQSSLVLTCTLVSTKNNNESKKLKQKFEKSFSWGTGPPTNKRGTPVQTTVKCYQEKLESNKSKSSAWQKGEEPLVECEKQAKQAVPVTDSTKKKKLRATTATVKNSTSQSKRLRLKRNVKKEREPTETQSSEVSQEDEAFARNSPSSGYAHLPFSEGYIYAIHKNPLLTQEEEAELSNYLKKQSKLFEIQQRMMQQLGRKLSLEEWSVRAGMSVQELHEAIILGNNAKERLITSNLRLVHSIASRFAYDSNKSFRKPVQLVDLIQEGILGLIQATDKFDASYGWRFSTFATWWIRASISKYLNEYNRSVRVPAKVLALFNQSKKVATELENDKKAPSESEVCSLLGVSSSRLRCCIEAVTNQPVSLERLGELLEDNGRLGQGAVYCVVDTRECTEENLTECLLRADVLKVLQEYLLPMEMRALMLRYGLRDGRYRSLEECGRIMSCSRERVRQLLLSGITKLRNSTVESFLKDYLQ